MKSPREPHTLAVPAPAARRRDGLHGSGAQAQIRRLVTLIALVAGTLLPAAGAAGMPPTSSEDAAGVGIRLVDAPLETQDNPRARLYIVDHVAPGEVIERRIEVSNDTGTESQIEVYPGAAEVNDGSFVGLAADTPNALSTWTSVDRPTLSLANGAQQLVSVTIDVPADAAPGEQYAVIWAQTTSAAADGTGVTEVNRVGIRVYLSVGPGGEPASRFTIDSLTAGRNRAGTPIVLATVQNTGGRALDLSGSLDLSDGPGELSAGPFPVEVGNTLGVGDTQPVEVELGEQLPNGPWSVDLTLTSGLLTETVRETLTFPGTFGSGETVQVDPGVPAAWWWVGAIALIAALLALGRGLRRPPPLHRAPAHPRRTEGAEAPLIRVPASHSR